MPTPTLCLNMIVKNESAIIESCLASVAPHIAAYVICDTGSTDDTEAIITRFFAARNIPGHVVHAPFVNFEQARNAALDAARASSLKFDYILLCDADMKLVVTDPRFRDRLTGEAYSIIQRTVGADLEYPNLRLLRRSSAARYRGVTHEYLDVGNTPRPILDGVRYLDTASGANRATKYQRDIALLTQGLRDEPDNARYAFYLANSYFDLRGTAADNTQAIHLYKRRAEMGGWPEEVFYSHYRIAQCLQRLGKTDEMIITLLDTFDRFPHRAEPLHLLTLHYQSQSKHHLAAAFAEVGANIPKPEGALFVEPDVYAWRMRDLLAVSLYWIGRTAESYAINAALLPIVPVSERARIEANLRFAQSTR